MTARAHKAALRQTRDFFAQAEKRLKKLYRGTVGTRDSLIKADYWLDDYGDFIDAEIALKTALDEVELALVGARRMLSKQGWRDFRAARRHVA